MPTWLTEQGFAGHMYKTLDGAVDKYTGKVIDTPAQATARLFGFNIYPFDPEATREKNIYFMGRDIRDIKQRATFIVNDENLTKAEQKEVKEAYVIQIKEKAKELKEYKEESKINPALK